MVTADGNRPASPTIINQRIDGFLEHPFLVADNNCRRADIDKVAQPVVAVNHPPVEVVEVAGSEPAAVQLHHRSQIRRQYRQHGKNHPLGFITAVPESLHHPQLLAGFLTSLPG